MLARLLIFIAIATTSSASAEVVVTRDDVFYVPFTASNDLTVQNLSLFVSGDQGVSWQFYQRQPASSGRFSFRAGVDGEFWFAVRPSSDADGTETARFDQPELQVAVDRQHPRLSMLASRAPGGEIVCRWTVEDPYLDLTSLQIQFQSPGQTQWSQADIDAESMESKGPITTGTATLAAPEGASVVLLRGYVKDQAGNLATVERNYDLASLPNSERAGPLTGPPQAVQSPELSTAPVAKQQQTAPEPFQVQRADQGPNVATKDGDKSETGNDYGWRAGSPALPKGNSDVATDNPLDDLPPGGGVSASTRPLVANYPSTGERNVLAETSQRASNSRRFELVYGVDTVSADEIHRVEVWYTQDGGRTWRHHGDDLDLVSPYLMEVENDGTVGVRMLVQTRSGFTIRPPESGDPADVWIRVDATQPIARITSVRYGTGEHAGSLELYWEAQDDNLADRPILFLYGDRPQGPWRKVADPLPNTGRFVWAVDDRAPAQIYLRMEVRDTAGNVTEETLPTPINNQRIAPRGHIHNVRPAAFNYPGSLAR